jgi:hypothetical protein
MTLAISLVIASAVSLVAILWVAVTRGLRIRARPSLGDQIQPLDVEAFRNLADPAEDEYLRRRLPPSEFRKVRRTRLRALAAYVKTAGRNAAVLVRRGQDALTAGNVPTAEAASQMVNQALLLRRQAILARVRIYGAMGWPNSNLPGRPVLDGYQRLSGTAMFLGRLRNSAIRVRPPVW